MRRTRLIPVLLLQQQGIYKTKKFKSPTYIGDPLNTIRIFNDLEVDEIVILDIDASKKGIGPNYETLEDLASEAFMPVGYGGGIRTVDEARQVFDCGVEKVIFNYALQNGRDVIRECALRFGSQSVVASIDYGSSLFGTLKQYDHVTRKLTSQCPFEAVARSEELGAGEVLLTSVDRDGMMQGLDIEIIAKVANSLQVPLIACGGAGTLNHVQQAANAGASAIAGGSMFVFRGSQRGILINYPGEGQLRSFLN